MAAPALRIPLGLDTQTFEKSIADAKSLTSSATDFVVKEFAKMQAKSAIKLAINSDEFKPAVANATKFLGDQFAAVKPQIQAFTQTAVKETTEAGLKVASVFASPAIKGSFQAFTAVGVPAAAGLATALAPIAVTAAAVAAALYVVVEAVGAAREQIVAMVAVADKASNLTVSPQFLQLFEGESRKLKVTVEELDTALSNAFNATKEKSPVDLAKWEVAGERITDVELALRVYNAELEKASGTQLQGLTLFRDAQTQDDKIKSILQSMVELDKVGQHLQSLELGEKFFGAQFVDRIRQGKTSADGILDTMEKLKASQDGIFADSLVNRAKDVDDQLKLSQDRLSRAMKPAWDDLAGIVLTIKGYWADVVGLIAAGVEQANKLGSSIQRWELQGKRDELKAVNDAIKNGTGLLGAPQVPEGVTNFLGMQSPQDRLKARRDRLQGEIDSGDRALLNTPEGPAAPAAPSRGAGATPTLKKKDNDARDPFDTAVDTVEKRIATLKAETETIDLSTAARDRAKTVATLEEAAKRANTAAGKENTAVTDEQRKKIELEADAVQKATDAYTRKQVASQLKFDAGTAFLSQSDVAIATQLKGIYGTDIPAALNSTYASTIRANEATKEISNTISTNLTTSLADVIDGTKTAGQAFQDFSKVVIRAIEEAIIKLLIVGPLMRGLQGGLGGDGFSFLTPAVGTAGSAFFGPVAPAGIGANAEGTDNWSGGPTWVGEKGPEIVNLPRGAQVVPNAIASRSAGTGTTIQNTFMVAGEVSPGTIDRLATAVTAAHKRIDGQARVITSTQAYQATGVSR